MKKIISTLFSLLIAISLLAQGVDRYAELARENSYRDVVYLKNGSIIRGFIIEQSPNVSLKILTRDNNVFVYKIDEVDKITKEKQLDSEAATTKKETVNTESNNTAKADKDKSTDKDNDNTPLTKRERKEAKYKGYFQTRKRGFSYLAQVGTSIYLAPGGDGSTSQAFFSFEQLIGGRPHPLVNLGWFTGIDYANIQTVDFLIFTSGIGMRAAFIKKRVSPTLDWNLGGGIFYTGADGESNIDPIMSFKFAPGIKFWAGKKVAISFNVGYKLVYDFNVANSNTGYAYHSVPIMFGVEF